MSYKENQQARKNKHYLLSATYHSTLEPGCSVHIDVGTYSVRGSSPKFDIAAEPVTDMGKDIVCRPIELVDLNNMTYELVYSCQNFSDQRVKVSFTWKDGQEPVA